MQNRLTKATKSLLDIMFYIGTVVTIAVPLAVRVYGHINSYFRKYYIPLCVLFMLAGLFAILIIRELRRMFETVLKDNCFIQENVVSLNKMGNYSFIIAIVTSFRLFLYFTPAVCIVIIVFMIAGLFSKVLSQVFDRAVTYKLENDLTI